MCESLDVNLDVLNKQAHHINDSLKLASGKGKQNLVIKAKWNPLVSLERISIESYFPTFLSYESLSTSGRDELDENSASSIEATRDTPSSYVKHRTSWNGCLVIEGDFPPHNSTFIENKFAKRCDEPLLSPITVLERQVENAVTESSNSVGNEAGVDCPEKPISLCGTDEGWLSDVGTDPPWLTSTSSLSSIPPKTYTPRSKRNLVSDLLKRPSKQPFRTSSPTTPQQCSKAKRSMMEKLELSSISDAEFIDDSLELVPRPDTPGTVNSDEIVPCSSSLSDVKPWHCEPKSPKVEDGVNNPCTSSSGDAISSAPDVEDKSSIEADVIGYLPSIGSNQSIHITRVKSWRRLHSVRDILEDG